MNEKTNSQKVDAFIKKVTEDLKNELSQKKGMETFTIHTPAIINSFEKNSNISGTVTVSNSVIVDNNKTIATLLIKNQKPNEDTEMKFTSDSVDLSTILISR